VENAAKALIWVPCTVVLIAIIDKLNRRRIDKRIEKGEAEAKHLV